MQTLQNGTFILGTAATEDKDGDSLYEFTVLDDEIVEFKPSPKLFKLSAEFLLRSGSCCLITALNRDHFKYWLVPI